MTEEQIPDLEQKCPRCDGSGGGIPCDEPGWVTCEECSGSGFVPTSLGRKVLTLMRHNTRLTINVEFVGASAS
jgi:DnaJ-class molecular chaperone